MHSISCCSSPQGLGLNELVVTSDTVEELQRTELVVKSDRLEDTVAELQRTWSHVDERLRFLEKFCESSVLGLGQDVLERLAKLEKSTVFWEQATNENASTERSATEGVAGVLLATSVQSSEDNDVARTEGSNNDRQPSSMWQTMQVAVRSYKIEENVYGLIVMPGRPLRFGAWLLLLVHYSLVGGLSYMIYDATAKASQETINSLDSLCNDVGESWDCTEPDLRRLTDFESLDSNRDGNWSLAEARDEGLVWQFRMLHEVAVQSKDVLKLVAPGQSYLPNTFCQVTWEVLKAYLFVVGENEVETVVAEYIGHLGGALGEVEMTKGWLWAEAEAFGQNPDYLKSCTVDFSWFENLERNSSRGKWLCFVQHMCTAIPGTPAISSEKAYMSLTAYYSSFPKATYEIVSQNLLNPCFLLDKDQCANAEISSSLFRLVPRWQKLDIAERVRQCGSYVADVCPHILGDRFRTFVEDTSAACGDRSYNTTFVPTHTELDNPQGISCRDDGQRLPEEWDRFAKSDFSLELLVSIVNRSGRNTFPISCEHVYGSGWCSSSNDVLLRGPDGRLTSTMIGDWMASVCPDTCCRQMSSMTRGVTSYAVDPRGAIPISCDSRCYQASKHGHIPNPVHKNFSRDCFGFGCPKVRVRDDGSGTVGIQWMPHGFDIYKDALKIAIKGNRSVRVNVLRVFPGGDPSCQENSLQIDGTRVCAENLQDNQQVFVPLRGRGTFDIRFIPRSACLRDGTRSTRVLDDFKCQWEVIIVDGGDRDEYTVSEVVFETQVAFGTSTEGKRSLNFVSFFSLILLVWIGFMWQESIKIKNFAFFIVQSPNAGQSGEFTPRVERTILFLCAVLPRLAVWGWVMIVGVMLLTVSTDFVEIVLNSVALSFILDIDEYLFAVMVPRRVKRCLIEGGFYEWPSKHRKAFADLEVFIVVGFMLSFVALIVISEYFREAGFLETASRIDCVCLLQGSHCNSGVLN